MSYLPWGHPYTKSLDVSNEQDALAELALSDRDPAAYQTKTAKKSRPPSEAVTIDGPSVGRFLEFLRSESRTERYRRNVQQYCIRSTSTVLDGDLQQGIGGVRQRLACYVPARSAAVSA